MISTLFSKNKWEGGGGLDNPIPYLKKYGITNFSSKYFDIQISLYYQVKTELRAECPN